MINTYSDLADFGKTLLANKQLDEGLVIISTYLKKLTNAMRCSIFVHDKQNHMLWTILSNGVEKIVIPDTQGIVGYVLTTQKEMIENAVANNPHFLDQIDKSSGYETVNMLACPIYDSKDNVIGVLQLINKLEGFSDEDMLFIKVVIRFISTYIEVALVHESK